MNPRSTQVQLAHDGSTRPDSKWQELEREAVAIREHWLANTGLQVEVEGLQVGGRRAGSRQVEGPLKDPECLRRHKSLVLNLVLEDYQREKETHEVDQSISIQEFCRRFDGLGDSFEQSIVRQLEVQQYLDHHPELIHPDSAFVWPEPGEEFLHFDILEELGRGTLARVYLCKQQELGGRSAVVKIALGTKAFEASLLGKLRHPHIMPVHWADHDSTEGANYISMPFLGRSTLVDLVEVAFRNGTPASATVIQEAAQLWIRPIDVETLDPSGLTEKTSYRTSYVTGIVRLASEIADALSYAHKQEVIHGDVKPSNVLLTSGGSPLLFDFNLGRDLHCLEGPAGGTLAYMAPEQMLSLTEEGSSANEPKAFSKPLPQPFSQPTTATDIYSFGALLYELLFGKSLLEMPTTPTETQAIARQLYSQQLSGNFFQKGSKLAVEGPLVELLEECLAFEPGDRPASMEQVRDRLVEQSLLPARGRRFVKKHPRRSWFAGLAFVAAIAFAAVGAYVRPPFAERLVTQAVAAREAGEYQASIELLNKALNADPDAPGARLERARCYLKMKDYVLARGDLLPLLKSMKDPAARAFVAYSRNLTNEHDSAIALYRESLENDFETAGVLNNLSVSLLVGGSKRPLKERIVQSEVLLKRAIAMKPESPIIRMNAVRLGIVKHSQDPNYLETDAVEHADWIFQNSPKEGPAMNSAFELYNLLAQRDPTYHSKAYACLSQAINLGAGPTPKILSGRIFSKYRTEPTFDALLETAKRFESSPSTIPPTPIGRFLDPISSEP